MHANFRGLSFTIAMEKELMILDSASLGLTNAIEALLEDAANGDIKPELH